MLDRATLRPLDPEHAVIKIEVLDVDAYGLGQSKPRREHQLDVARSERAVRHAGVT